MTNGCYKPFEFIFFTITGIMALQKFVPSGDAPSVIVKPVSFSSKKHENPQVADTETSHPLEPDVDIDLREIYFLIMHFLSAGPCHKTFGQLWNELLEHQLLPRRYHALYSRNGAHSGDENDDGMSFPLSYNMLVVDVWCCLVANGLMFMMQRKGLK